MENSRYKFRAWDTEEKEMLEVVALYFETMEMRYLNKQGKVETIDHANVYVSRGDDKYTTIVRSLKGLEIMQFTGLKDINGVDIYEGDIIEVTSDEYLEYNFSWIKKGDRFVISWIEELYGIGMTKTNDYRNGKCEACMAELVFSDDHESSIGCWSTIIGNIYENPELIKEK